MKKILMLFLILALMLPISMALAEAVDPMPVLLLEEAQFFNLAMLGTFAGAAAAAEILVLLLKWILNLQGNAMRYAVVGCSILTVAAGRFLSGDDFTLANIILSVLNGGIVAASLMKLYEVTAGYSKTPAGTITS